MKRFVYSGGTVALAIGIGAGAALAQTFTDFEPAGFVDGETVHNLLDDGTVTDSPMEFIRQCGEAWFVPDVFRPPQPPATPTDEEVVDLVDNKVWRFSQGGSVPSHGRPAHSAHSNIIAGETGALNDAGCGVPTTANFYGEVTFTSATGAAQDNLQINVVASSGDTRHAFVRILDDGSSNLDVTFFDTVDGCTFNGTAVDANLDPSQWHRLGIEIFFVDGLAQGTAGDVGAEGNDVVNVYLNEALVHTGTSWESCVGARSVDRLLFSYGTQQTDQAGGGGLYFDDVLVTDLCPDDGRCPPPPPEFDSVGECVSTLIGDNCSGLRGRDRATCNHEQQMFCFDLFGVR